ncbi:MAG: hypothetical protein EP335_14440 [Alphaproteobacteria bacterium]|nr:MAG: hypothetical protein EP335_14440 [Alphaproteobacteria bacterium]
MTFVTPTVANILGQAWLVSRKRWQLLMLLALLSGIVSSILYRPATAVINEVLAALESGGDAITEEHVAAAAEALSRGGGALLVGHLLVTLVATMLLVPWARAAAPGGLVPAAGGMVAFLRRGVRSFLHMVAANGITVLLTLLVLPVAATLAGLLGALAGLINIAALLLLVWISLSITGTAHLAIAAEARDRQETLYTAWIRAKLFLRAIAGSLAAILFILMTGNLIVGGLVFTLLPEATAQTVSSVLGGALIYLTSALHVAGVYIVPDFRDLRADLEI